MSSEDLRKMPGFSRTYQIVTVGFGILLIVLLIAYIFLKSREIFHVVKPVRDFSESIGKHGMKSEAPQRDTAAIMSLTAGEIYRIQVDGKPIWLVYFDPNDKVQADAMAALKSDPTVKIDGQSHPVKFHGSLALIGFDNHPDQAKILESLDDFEAPTK
jgi:hypothetical protein